MAEERADRLVRGRGEGRAVQQNQARAIDNAIRRGGGQGARLDDGGAVVAAEARQGHATVTALKEIASAGDLARIGRVGRLVNRDGPATEFDARIGITREVIDGLGRVIEANRGLATARARVEHDIRSVDEGVILAIGEGQRDTVLDDDLPVEVLLLVINVDHAELAVADVRGDAVGVRAGRDRANDEVLRGNREGRPSGAVDLGTERARIILNDAERAARADDDAAITQALDVSDNLAPVDGDFTDRGALAHQGQRAHTFLNQSTKAAVDAAREVTVAVGVLQDRQRRARGDIHDRASTRARDPHVRGDFAPEGLEVANRLVRSDAELRGGTARQVTGAPLRRAAGVISGVGTGETRMGAIRANEVDRVGEAKRQVVRVGKDEVTATDEHVARDTAGVKNSEGARTRLVDAARTIDAADRTNDTVVDVYIGDVISVLTHI